MPIRDRRLLGERILGATTPPHVGGGVMGDPMTDAATADNLGFKAQTANGTSRAYGRGWNWDPPYEWPQVEGHPAWPGGRSNRTGE